MAVDHIPHREACASVVGNGADQIAQPQIEGGTATVDCGGVSLEALNVAVALQLGILEYGELCAQEAIRQVLRGQFGPLGVAVKGKV